MSALLVIVGALVVGLFMLVASRPRDFRVVRTVAIDAPPERIFPLINDLRQFNTWSPYENKDPAMKRTFSGPASGPGSVYAFDGNSQVGAGRLEISAVDVPTRVAIQLDMIKPIAASNLVEFTLTPRAGGTQITWAMTGCNGFIGKLMGLFFNMDRMIGNDFEAGLAALKSRIETPSTKETSNG